MSIALTAPVVGLRQELQGQLELVVQRQMAQCVRYRGLLSDLVHAGQAPDPARRKHG